MIYHLDVKTTTFVNRNIELLRFARDNLVEDSREPLRILQIGPGMALKGIGRYNHFGKCRPVKRLETVLRRLPLPVRFYETFETREILDVFHDFRLKLTVADISRKSLDVVKNCFGEDIASAKILDLAVNHVDDPNLVQSFDMVICMATVVRVPPAGRPQALKNLCAFLRPGGFVLTEQDMTVEGFDGPLFSRQIFRKPQL